MLRNLRKLQLDVYDYVGNKICPLYDSESDVPGQAVNVVVTTERNGWRELSFTIPSTFMTVQGEEVENYRLQYLIGDYRVRLVDDDGIDWFLISEPKVTHSAFSKNVQVSAGHISQLLKTKNLGLEFSDKNGNNIGTPDQLLKEILEGTGWSVGNVDTFYEKDGKTLKIRSLSASVKTGAFKLITKMCELFDAKPIFHGEGRTVDIVPLNPFSEPTDGELPDVAKANGVIELHYGRNVKNVTRTLNTENLVTKLYAYGAYGDDVSGYCGIDELEHRVITLTVSKDIQIGEECCFSFLDDTGIEVSYSFSPTASLSVGDQLSFSLFDPASMLYVWDNSRRLAYKVVKGYNGDADFATVTETKGRNWFSFIMDFSYYTKTGLLTDEHIQSIAEYQHDGSKQRETISKASADMVESQQVLSETIGYVNFCKLNVDHIDGCVVTLKGTSEDDGVLYRTDYDVVKTERFKWRVSNGLKPNGDSVNEEASVVYIIDSTTDPVQYQKTYISKIEDVAQENGETVTQLTLFSLDNSRFDSSCNYYLFSSNNINGYLGAFETADESATIALENAVKVVTSTHPVYFSLEPPVEFLNELNGYGWWCKIYDTDELPEMYFCYAFSSDTSWHRVFCQDVEPEIINKAYWYDWKRAILLRCLDNKWVKLKTEDDESVEIGTEQYVVRSKVVESFSSVYRYMMVKDKYLKGYYQKSVVTIDGYTPTGNYYIKDKYGSFYVFTTSEDLHSGDILSYDTTEGSIEQISGEETDTLEVKTYRFDNVEYHPQNVCNNASLTAGSFDLTTGAEIKDDNQIRSSSLRVYPSLTYQYKGLSVPCYVLFFTKKNAYIDFTVLDSNEGSFVSPENAAYIRLMALGEFSDFAGLEINVPFYDTSIIIEEETYYFAGDSEGSGELKGIRPLMKKFDQYAYQTYEVDYLTVKEEQEAFTEMECKLVDQLGDMYREGYWQNASYVDGDEQKLYDDALENLKKISQPEAKYTVGFLDLYGAEDQSITKASRGVRYPELSTMSAVHLVDPEIEVNCWAFLDKLSKCYDQPWKTTVTINTNLTTIGQHSFTDVMTNIANVASEVKGKDNIYSRAASLGAAGQLSTERLEGTLNTDKIKISGGSSTWYTDSRGNTVYESVDGSSAMMLSGNGFAIADSKDKHGAWNWRTFGTGAGFSADAITTGRLSAKLIEAGGITTDQLSPTVGQQLNISSNHSLAMFATTDGTKPSGAVLTDGSIIEINTNYINIGTSGKLNLSGSEINVNSTGKINVNGGDISIVAGGTLHVQAGAVASSILLGSESNVLTSDGAISLANGSIVFDGNNCSVYIGQDVNVDIVGFSFLGAESPYASNSTAYNSATVTTLTLSKAMSVPTAFNMSYNYQSAVLTVEQLPSIANGTVLQLVASGRGLNIYADQENDVAIITPSVTSGHLLGWNKIDAQLINGTAVSAHDVYADAMYMNDSLVATQKWCIETMLNLISNLLPQIA